MKLFIDSQTSTFAPFKFSYGSVISPHISLGMCILILAGIYVKFRLVRGTPWGLQISLGHSFKPVCMNTQNRVSANACVLWITSYIFFSGEPVRFNWAQGDNMRWPCIYWMVITADSSSTVAGFTVGLFDYFFVMIRASYRILLSLRVAHAPGMPGTFSPPPIWKETAS